MERIGKAEHTRRRRVVRNHSGCDPGSIGGPIPRRKAPVAPWQFVLKTVFGMNVDFGFPDLCQPLPSADGTTVGDPDFPSNQNRPIVAATVDGSLKVNVAELERV